jgi:hypothetical protein
MWLEKGIGGANKDMEISVSSILQSIDESNLTPVVRQALGRDQFQILDWQASQLGGGAGNPVSVGLCRFEGNGMDGGEWFRWSLILKVIQSPANVGWSNMGEGQDPTHWNYWKREFLLYQSGLLDTLPEGMAAPRCYAAAELPGDVALLWLEDIQDSYKGVWPLDRYALTARHLGRLNGTYLSGVSLPDFVWLSQQRARQWITFMPWGTTPWEHPRLLERYPKPEVNSFRRMLLESEHFLAKLDLLPKTISHGDTYPTNFKSRQVSANLEHTVALDWALTGIAPIGDDLGQFVFGAQMNLTQEKREDVDKALFESYLAGLQDVDCHIDPRLVRFGYTASAALRVGLFQLYLIEEDLKQDVKTPQQAVERPAPPDCFEVVMAEEAFRLLEAMGQMV